MIEAMSELNLFIVSIDILSEGFRLTEIERRTFNLQNFTCRDSGSICWQIEVCINLTDQILNAWGGICCSCQTEESMMCQVDNGLLIGGSQILYHQLILIGEGEFNRHIEFASKAFLSI